MVDEEPRPKVVIAGQVPPPVLGQYVATADLLARLNATGRFRVEHLPFRFARSSEDLRVARLGKIVELARIVSRISRIRLRGRIDCLIYPVGGPSAVVVVRDALLFRVLRWFSKRTVLLFHSGGHAEAWADRSILRSIGSRTYRQATSAIVLTEFGRRDPEHIGMRDVFVVPHQLADQMNPDLISRGRHAARLLHLGTIDRQKGVPDLLEAISRLDEDIQLVLVGESGASYPESDLLSDIARLGLEAKVERKGVLTGREKAAELGRADLVVFASTHPGETFGLVLVEAMMWALPVVTVRWRGAPEVVGDVDPQLVVDPNPPLSDRLEQGLRFAMANRSQWAEWGTRNRVRYEERFLLGTSSALEDAIQSALEAAVTR